MIKYISFDLDGTLADETFDSLIWNEEIPKLFAKKNKVSLEEAKTRVYAEYYKALYIEKIRNWTDIYYWFKRFNFKDWKVLLQDMKKHVFLYSDTIESLQYLSKKYRLIIISNSEEKFLNIKLEAEGLKKYFDKIYSAPTNFNISKKNAGLFLEVLKKLKINKEEVIHIGDDHYLDYEVPSSVGIKSFHLVRSKNLKQKHTIHSLLELKNKL
ncbi:HAD family hydrolase [Candidatus Woesearchaeota archaeon]|nr:HAD family hydrolase [Candidatus Woesearchaeota archaeon]